MIPVKTVDKDGNIAVQVFNDDLPLIEKTNRAFLGTYTLCVDKLTDLSTAVQNASLTDTQLTAVITALQAVQTAVNSLETTVNGYLV